MMSRGFWEVSCSKGGVFFRNLKISLQRVTGDIYRNPAWLAKMSFEERRKLVSTFFSGRTHKTIASESTSKETGGPEL
jgi:hypothetical protein